MSNTRTTLIGGLNWIGDAIMSMPALQQYRVAHPEDRVVMLVKPPLRDLWTLHTVPDEIWVVPGGRGGTLQTARMLRNGKFDAVYVLPHSFRSALWPWLARIPERVGLPGHFRDWMMTRVIHPHRDPARAHQSYEYLSLFFPDDADRHPGPVELRIPESATEAVKAWMPMSRGPYLGLVPGAARGPSKQWPKDYFVETARWCMRQGHAQSVAVFGSPGEHSLCESIAKAIGSAAINCAGRTTLPQWAAAMSLCRVVVANDSGGMHLAAAVGTPLVAVFGMTDPAVTGPLGQHAKVVKAAVNGSRDIARDSDLATRALKSITPDRVMAEIDSLMVASYEK